MLLKRSYDGFHGLVAPIGNRSRSAPTNTAVVSGCLDVDVLPGDSFSTDLADTDIERRAKLDADRNDIDLLDTSSPALRGVGGGLQTGGQSHPSAGHCQPESTASGLHRETSRGGKQSQRARETAQCLPELAGCLQIGWMPVAAGPSANPFRLCSQVRGPGAQGSSFHQQSEEPYVPVRRNRGGVSVCH